jgi:hypothetical protein
MADKKLYDRPIDNGPATDRRISFGKVGVLTLNMTFASLFTYLKSNISYDDQYLNKANVNPYIPTLDYHPVTKKFLEDNTTIISQSAWLTVVPIGGKFSFFDVKVAQWGQVVCMTGEVEVTDGTINVKVATIPNTIDTSTQRIHFISGDGNQEEVIEWYILENTRDVYFGAGTSTAQNEVFCVSYLAI